MEPLSEERMAKWRKEMDWLLSPANYMVELVPAKQSGANGRTFEVSVFPYSFDQLFYIIFLCFVKTWTLEQIMTPKARADVHINLPALQKIDSMLIVCENTVSYS